MAQMTVLISQPQPTTLWFLLTKVWMDPTLSPFWCFCVGLALGFSGTGIS